MIHESFLPSDDGSIDRRTDQRRTTIRRIDDAPAASADKQPDPMIELRALAATVRNCQRTGHPDMSKHLDTLLTKLGA